MDNPTPFSSYYRDLTSVCHHTDTNMREFLARQFGAFKKAIRPLEQYYKAPNNPAVSRDTAGA